MKSLLGRRARSRPNLAWYEDGEPGTREQWRKRAYDAENNSMLYGGLHIKDAFIVLGSAPLREGGVPSSLTYSHIYALGDYVPCWARRPRLRRLRPLVRRAEVAKALWRWSKDKPGAACAISYPYPSDERP